MPVKKFVRCGRQMRGRQQLVVVAEVGRRRVNHP